MLPAYDGPRPDPDRKGYVSVTHAISIAAPPERVKAWADDPGRSLADIVEFDSGMPAVAGTDALVGDWTPGAREGHRRRVRFTDGSCLAEEVLVDSPTVFRYLVWGFTAPRQRFAIRQGLAEFRFEPRDGGTRLEWTYAFLPTFPLLRPAVRRFLRTVMTPMMTATLTGIRDGVLA